MKDIDFIDLFVCPLCRNKLDYVQQTSLLKCPQCGCEFPIIEGMVDALVPIEGLITSSVDLASDYERWGGFLTRTADDERRRDISVGLVEGDLVLEIGCAEGFMTRELSKKAPQVIGSDIAFSYLKRAKKAVPDARFARLDVHNIPFADDTFDCLFCTEVLEHTLSPFRALEEIHRVIKPEGYLVISVPNGMTAGRILQHVLRKKASLVYLQGAHVSFFDTGSLLQILDVTGFVPKVVTTDFIDVPLPLVGRFVGKYLPYLGHVTIVKAAKKRVDYWERLDRLINRRLTG